MAATNMTNFARAAPNGRLSGHRALRRGRVSLPGYVYLVTAATRDRHPVFRDFVAGCAAARSFMDPRVLGDASPLAWVLMPDHAHWLIRLGDGDDLAVVVKRLKSVSARNVNRSLHRNGPLWAPAFHDHALRGDEDLRHSARYVIANPVRAGLVEHVGSYPFWDAIWA